MLCAFDSINQSICLNVLHNVKVAIQFGVVSFLLKSPQSVSLALISAAITITLDLYERSGRNSPRIQNRSGRQAPNSPPPPPPIIMLENFHINRTSRAKLFRGLMVKQKRRLVRRTSWFVRVWGNLRLGLCLFGWGKTLEIVGGASQWNGNRSWRCCQK